MFLSQLSTISKLFRSVIIMNIEIVKVKSIFEVNFGVITFEINITRCLKIEINVFVKIITLNKCIIVIKAIIFKIYIKEIKTSTIIVTFRRFSRDDIDYIYVFLYSSIKSLTKSRFLNLY